MPSAGGGGPSYNPEASGGPDIEENAAPLCPSYHATYGANPEKRKFIREARDHWYEVCDRRFLSDPDGLAEIRQLLQKVATRDDLHGLRDEVLRPQSFDKGAGRNAPQGVELNIGNQKARGVSQSGRLHYELRCDPHGPGVEVWLCGDANKNAVKLCDTEGWGNLRLHFAPNDQFVIVQDGGSSLGIHLRLFSRDANEKGLRFNEDERADIDGKAERLALKQSGLPEREILDHRYSHCWWWSSDSKFIVISVSGHGVLNREAYRLSWVGLYCLKTRKAVTDLREVYANAVTRYE